ncbi:MAG: hypothetical protein ACKOZT_15045 [Cyanobium sp.]
MLFPLIPRLRIGSPLLAAVLLLAAGGAAQAQVLPLTPSIPTSPATGGGGPRLTPEQRQRIFPETRALALQDHQARIGILQQGQRCIGAAANGDALRQCMRQERQAVDVQRSRHREALRGVFVRAGIPVPDWSQRQGRRQEGPGGPGGAPRAGQGWDQPAQPGAAPY